MLARPTIQNMSVVGSDFLLEWSAIPGTKYRVQFKHNLEDADWTDLIPDVTASGTLGSFNDPLSNSQRFFRVQVIAP